MAVIPCTSQVILCPARHVTLGESSSVMTAMVVGVNLLHVHDQASQDAKSGVLSAFGEN